MKYKYLNNINVYIVDTVNSSTSLTEFEGWFSTTDTRDYFTYLRVILKLDSNQ